MKADERHKLKSNQFAVFMQDFPEKLKQHARLLMWSGAVIVLAIAVAFYLHHRSKVRQGEAWNEFSAAVNALNGAMTGPQAQTKLAPTAERFGQAAAAYPDNQPVTAWSYYYQGQALLTEAGLRGKVGGPGRYLDLIGKAEQAFGKVLEQPYDPVATPAARVALGNIALDRGSFDAARNYYTQVEADEDADGELKALALRRRKLMPAAPERVVFVPAPADRGTPGASSEVTIPLDPADGPSVPAPPPLRVTPAPTLPQTPDTGEPGPQTGPPPGATTRPDSEGEE